MSAKVNQNITELSLYAHKWYIRYSMARARIAPKLIFILQYFQPNMLVHWRKNKKGEK